MMPNAPTDNLYKFVTFLGVALLIFSSWSLTEAIKRWEAAQVQQYAQQAQAVIRQTNIDARIAQLKSVTENTTMNPKEKQAQAEKLTAEILSYTDKAVDAAFAEMQPELVTLQHKDDVLMYKWGVGISLLMTSLGILAWYFRHQRYQDQLLIDQVRNTGKAKPKDPSAEAAALSARYPIWRRVGFLTRARSIS